MAFGAPVGGLLLAIEEGASFLSMGMFWRGFLATCTGVLALQFLAQCHTAGGAVLQTKFGVWRDLGYVQHKEQGRSAGCVLVCWATCVLQFKYVQAQQTSHTGSNST